MVLYHLKITRLTRAKKGGEIGNKHQVGIRSARTELEATLLVGSLLWSWALQFTSSSGCCSQLRSLQGFLKMQDPW